MPRAIRVPVLKVRIYVQRGVLDLFFSGIAALELGFCGIAACWFYIEFIVSGIAAFGLF